MGKVKKRGKKTEEEQVWVTRSGTVITEEIAEQMAEEFERNPPDPSTLRRRYVGRPSLGPGGHSPRVSFRASPDLYKAAWARADKEGRSLSELAREALTQYMKS
ncbi:MAG TPA: ribbon-helix-helix domain-containing protein [Solirubrobacterales bacterium]|nr:ribbon-helix-helix domain-containing protein [Solirubrobacterales bacterium]